MHDLGLEFAIPDLGEREPASQQAQRYTTIRDQAVAQSIKYDSGQAAYNK